MQVADVFYKEHSIHGANQVKYRHFEMYGVDCTAYQHELISFSSRVAADVTRKEDCGELQDSRFFFYIDCGKTVSKIALRKFIFRSRNSFKSWLQPCGTTEAREFHDFCNNISICRPIKSVILSPLLKK